MSPRPRVLLVEDDPSIRRFVALALEESAVELLTCETVGEALGLLDQGGIALVITDLMLPGESGLGLVERLAQWPERIGRAKVVVFSAGITTEVEERLRSLQVWRMLRKPASVLDLDACVSEALALWSQPDGADATREAAGETNPPSANDTKSAEAQAIATHFAGNAPLFRAYRISCHAQFPHDQAAGDAAAAAGDAGALRRLGHSLATVLLTLGRPADSALARALETAAETQGAAAATALWQQLKERLSAPLPDTTPRP